MIFNVCTMCLMLVFIRCLEFSFKPTKNKNRHRILSSQFILLEQKNQKMKKHFFLLTLALLVFKFSIAQQSSGHVTYNVQFEENDFSQEELAMLPSEAEMWFDGDKMKMKMGMGMGMESSVIIRKNDVFILMDLMGNKMAIKSSRSEVEKPASASPPYRLSKTSDDTREIAGYSCKKAVFSAPGAEDMVVWYTDKLKSEGTWYYKLDEVNGFPLEFTMNTMNMKVRMVAREVSKVKPDETIFSINPDYKIMTQAEIKQLMGGSR